MTAYLRRGDRIHLAAPFNNNLSPEAAKSEGMRLHNEMVAFYATFGVTVVLTTTSDNPNFTHPVVIAVFRDDDRAEAAA